LVVSQGSMIKQYQNRIANRKEIGEFCLWKKDDQVDKINDLAKQPIHWFVGFCSGLSHVLKLLAL